MLALDRNKIGPFRAYAQNATELVASSNNPQNHTLCVQKAPDRAEHLPDEFFRWRRGSENIEALHQCSLDLSSSRPARKHRSALPARLLSVMSCPWRYRDVFVYPHRIFLRRDDR